MPIIGLTDRQASFPQIGILRKGGEKVDEKRPGKDLTYFRLDTNDEGVRTAFEVAYGDEPRDINCFLPFASVEENFQTSREEWTAGALKHRCDGVTCSVWLKDDGTYSQEPIPCPGGCKPQGRLKIIVAELRRLAYVTVMTTSLHDIMTLSDNLTAYEMLRGDLRGIPFVLKRRPRMVSTPGGNGKRTRREKWLLSIEAAPVWQNAQLSAMQHIALPDGRMLELVAPDDDDDLPALPSGIVVDQNTGEVIEEESAGGWLPATFQEFKEQCIFDFKRPWDELAAILKAANLGGFTTKKADSLYKALQAHFDSLSDDQPRVPHQDGLFGGDESAPDDNGAYSE